jgi:hypothetical protein
MTIYSPLFLIVRTSQAKYNNYHGSQEDGSHFDKGRSHNSHSINDAGSNNEDSNLYKKDNQDYDDEED